MDSTHQARILLRAALDLLGDCDLQAVADRTVTLATRSFATAARLDLVKPDGGLYPMAASDLTGEMILLSPRFHGGHPLIRRLIQSGSTDLEPSDEERRALWGKPAASEEIVLAAITVGHRTRGLLTFLGSNPNGNGTRDSDPLCRRAFVSIVSKAMEKAERCRGAGSLEMRHDPHAFGVQKSRGSTPPSIAQ